VNFINTGWPPKSEPLAESSLNLIQTRWRSWSFSSNLRGKEVLECDELVLVGINAGIKYSVRDLICDAIDHCVWICDTDKISEYDKIVMENQPKNMDMKDILHEFPSGRWFRSGNGIHSLWRRNDVSRSTDIIFCYITHITHSIRRHKFGYALTIYHQVMTL